MPQQPLSRVRSNARVYDSPDAIERRPELARLLGLAIGTWAEIEVRLILILTAVLKTSAAAAVAMVQISKSSRMQMNLINAAGINSLVDPELELFEAIMRIAGRLVDKRNLLAHDIWGHCDELPDALLRIETAAAIKVMINYERLLRDNVSIPMPPDQHPDLRIDPKQVWVYRKKDFEEIIEEMNKLRFFITSMHHFAAGSPTRGVIASLLNNEPLLQQELLRVRAGRQK